MGIHSNRVQRPSLNKKTAINAFSKINLKRLGSFFNIGIGMLFGNNFNTLGGTDGFTHQTGHTAGRSIISLNNSMTGARPVWNRPSFFGILVGRRGAHFLCNTDQMQNVKKDITKKMSRCNHEAPQDFSEIDSLQKIKLFSINFVTH